MRIILFGKQSYGFRFADLTSPFHYKWLSISLILPIKKDLFNLSL